MPSPQEVRALFRAFLREGKRFPNYNIREYVKRKAKEEFHEHKQVTDREELQRLWSKAQQDLQVTQRQALVYQLYAPKHKSVMEVPMVKVVENQMASAPYTS